MKTIYAEERRIRLPADYGPDPILMKKKGQAMPVRDIKEFKKKIVDENYIDHAINKIAMELSHFLTK